MAKQIKLTEEDIAEAVQDYMNGAEKFKEDLMKANMDDGAIEYKYSKKYPEFEKKANVTMESKAWNKQKALIDGFSSEVAWHCVSHRGENDGEFVVDDVIIYPQKVTGTTVNTDLTEYQKWYLSQPDDIYTNIRTQCHSHVNMGVSPSGTDLTDQKKTLELLGDDDYYIFMIWNKKYEVYCVIFDIANNVKYESEDIEVEIVDEDGVLDFMEEAMNVVKKETYTPKTSWNTNQKKDDGKKKEEPKKNAVATKEDKKVVDAKPYRKSGYDYYDDGYYGGYGYGYGGYGYGWAD